jgi:hypothetical protein
MSTMNHADANGGATDAPAPNERVSRPVLIIFGCSAALVTVVWSGFLVWAAGHVVRLW